MNERKEETIIKECAERLKTGKLPPWKVEEEIETNYRIIPPGNFRIAALCRQRFIEVETGERFVFISVAAQVLAGEFNLALEIAREKLYS